MQEDPLEESKAVHSSVLAWSIPWTEEPARLQFSVAQSRTRLKQLSTARNVIFTQKLKLQSLSLTEMLSKAPALYSQAHSVIFFLKKTPQITKTSTSQALESVS